MDLIAIASELGTQDKCLAFIEKVRWPEGVRCINPEKSCGSDKISKFEVKETTRKVRRASGRVEEVTVPKRHLYECLDCGYQFAATTGTLFHDSHLPLTKWFFAVALMVNAKKGLSAKQLQRDLKVTYKTAWYVCHRIREAMQSTHGLFGGRVEMDETFVGGRFDPRRHQKGRQKQAVMGVVQRSTEEMPSQVQAFPIPNRGKEVIAKVVQERVAPTAKIYTDEWSGYRHLKETHNHAIVIHSRGEYVRGDVHTNTAELFWGLFKRQLIGQHHWVSVKHLQRYLNESTWKFNNREQESLFALVLVNMLITAGLPYKKLIARPESE